MLRTKQLGSLSQCARSFILSGSRSSTADGAPSSCSEDEPCFSKKPTKSSDILYQGNQPSAVPKTAALPNQGTGYHEAETVIYPTAVPPGHSVINSSLRSDTVILLNGDKKDLDHSSLRLADHLVKAGVATVVFLSDIVNNRIPALDGSGLWATAQSSVVDSKPLRTITSSNDKSRKKTQVLKVIPESSVDVGGSSSNATHDHGSKGKTKKSDLVEGFLHVPNTKVGTSKGFWPVSSTNARTMEGSKHAPPMKAKTSGGHQHVSTTELRISEGSKRLSLASSDLRHCMPQRAKDHSPTPINPKPGRRVYQIKLAENFRSVEKVQQPTRSVRAHGGFNPSLNSGQVLDNVHQILRQLKWCSASKEALVNLGCKFDAYQANQILKRLQDHSVALSFFHWLKHQPGFKHDEHSYTTMVGILGRARQFGSIKRLLDEMVRDGCHPNVVTYNRLIHSYGRANYIDEAVNVFYRMQEVGCRPDRVTFCTLIDIHAKAGFLGVAMDMYKRMQEDGLSPDTFTYGVIINCLGKAGHLSSAHKLFCEMVSQGCVPNLVTYNIMITLQAKARNYPSALKLYEEMRNAGFQPDKVTYSIVMEVLGHCGYLNEAEALFAEMQRENWVPDEPVYGLLVDLWGKSGNVDKARGWYQLMLEAGLRPNVPTCNSLLSAFLRGHRFSEAYDLLQNMLRLGLSPSLQTYTLLLSCCTDAQYHGEMGLCCKLMAITGHPAHVFLVTMPAAGPDGQNVRDHASYFLDLMHSEDRESKRGLVDAVIDFLHKSGLKEEAGSVWDVALQKNVYPDAVSERSSCYWLINLHVMSDGTALIALSRTLAWFRKRLIETGVTPNRIDIVTGWGRRSRVTGSSLVRQSVHELLDLFKFPFFTQNGNTGCFIGSGEPLSSWLHHPYVERMHLL